MKDKNLPDDIKNKSLNELTDLANNIIKNLENKNTLDGSIEEYQKLIKLNLFSTISPILYLLASASLFSVKNIKHRITTDRIFFIIQGYQNKLKRPSQFYSTFARPNT